MVLEDIILSEVYQSEKDRDCIISTTYESK